MRKRSDVIEVRLGREADPVQFLWRGQLWRVLAIESRWIESGAWWTSAHVKAARGDDTDSQTWRHVGHTLTAVVGDDVSDDSSALLCEQEIWRVEAANGMAGSRGIYELAHRFHDASWRLQAVID